MAGISAPQLEQCKAIVYSSHKLQTEFEACQQYIQSTWSQMNVVLVKELALVK
jgi:hypothetical protein